MSLKTGPYSSSGMSVGAIVTNLGQKIKLAKEIGGTAAWLTPGPQLLSLCGNKEESASQDPASLQ